MNRITSRRATWGLLAATSLLMAQPVLAIEDAFASGLSSPQTRAAGSDLRVATVTSADLGGFAHRTAGVASPIRTEGLVADRSGAADREVHRGDMPHGTNVSDATESPTILEPAIIAVLGFTAAALIAMRRRRTADVPQESVQRIS